METRSRLADVDQLPERERVARICALLCKAIALGDAKRIVEVTPADTPTISLPGSDRPVHSHDLRVIQYLTLIGEAGPEQIRATLNFSRWEKDQALRRLVQEGRIVARGHTRSLTYSLSRPPPHSARLGRN